MNILKRKIRKLSLWLEMKTDLWIVPEEFWKAMDDEAYVTARLILDDLRDENPDDPEITYASSMLSMLDGIN